MTKCQVLRKMKEKKSFDPIAFQIKFNCKYFLKVRNKGHIHPPYGFPAKWPSVKDTDLTKTSNKKRNHKLLLS